MADNPLSSLKKIKSGVYARLWAANLNRLPKWQAWPLLALRLVVSAIQDLTDGQLSLRAMSLVYTTLLSLVPMLAISFSVLKGFGVHNQIEPLLKGLLEPLGDKANEITEHIIGFVDKIEVGVLGVVGLGLLIYSVIALMQKIERAFNYTWHVTRTRSLARRFSDYLSVLLVGPVMIFVAMGMAASAKSAPFLETLFGHDMFSTTFEVIGSYLPLFMIILSIAYIYKFMPNTHVNLSSALVGALTAGVCWKAIGWVFKSFIAGSAKYTAVYSAFATLIVLLIWLYLTWLVLLLGASVAFYHQNPNQMQARRKIVQLSFAAKEKLALMMMQLIGQRFYDGLAALTQDQISRHFHLPPQPTQDVLDALEQQKILTRTGEAMITYQPGKPLEVATIDDVLTALRVSGGTESFEKRIKATPDIESVLSDVARARESAADKIVLRDLIKVKS